MGNFLYEAISFVLFYGLIIYGLAHLPTAD